MQGENLHVLIVEDDPIVALDLATGLRQAGYEVVGIASNSQEAIRLFQSNDVDILLMDINLDGKKDGIDTVIDMIRIRAVPVIYLTAFTDPQTVARVKKTHPAAFLTKPYQIANVLIAVELALHNFASQSGQGSATISTEDEKEPVLQMKDHLFIKVNYRFIKLCVADILYLSAENNYIQLVTAERKYVLRVALQQFLEKLAGGKLVRIHRSYAVNLEAVQSFTDYEVTIGKEALPIGRSYKEGFLQLIHLFKP